MPGPDKLPASVQGAAAAPTTPATEPVRAVNTASAAASAAADAVASVPPPAVPQQQALALHVAAQAQELPRRAIRCRRLWLSVYLPALPLDALQTRKPGLGPGAEPGAACAVFDEQQGMRRIVLANRIARRQGVIPGLSVNAALALLPGLCLLSRNPASEERALLRLAAWAERFTSVVSLEPPDVLLLEIAGSVSLFGGRDFLRQTIETGLREQAFTFSTALAPVPLAAVWLARSGASICVMDTQRLNGALSPLRLDCLQWPVSVYESLQGMGIYCIGDCLRLPREGFARRFGAARLLQLDRALGRLPDPRVSYRSAERFCRDYELPEEQGDRELLLQASRLLLQQLEQFLLTRQTAVQQLRFSFFHLKGAATDLTLGCLHPERAAGHWFELLEMKFDRLALPAPVIAIRLRGGRAQALQMASANLPFQSSGRGQQGTSIAPLLERLAARIGDGFVHGVTAVAEHRPQYAWSTVPPLSQTMQQTMRQTMRQTGGERIPPCAALPTPWDDAEAAAQLAGMRRTGSLLLRRPLWMLAEPLALACERNMPHYQGPLRLKEGPERIESGWWDDNGIARDYFVAVNAHGVHLWIYRNVHDDADWYLQGIFG